MESCGNQYDEEWHNLSRMFISDEGSDHFANDFGLNLEIPNIFFTVSDESSNAESSFFVDDEHLVNVSDNINPNFYQFFCQENNISSSDASNGTICLSYPYQESFPFYPSNLVSSLSNHDMCDQSIESCMMNEIKINNSSLESLYLTQDVEKGRMENSLVSNSENPLKRKFGMPVAVDDQVKYQKTDTKPKKRTRVSRENKNKKNVQPKKSQKMNDTEDSNNNKNTREMNQQSSSSCSSNDDLNGSQEMNEALNQNIKTRASRGAATDPQSLYARKRRERINERLRILQNLVPNGTKVDISTMLEEAVEYVKFLKLQIQLLSSDDMWMYAPIAYNGMDMGLYKNILPNP